MSLALKADEPLTIQVHVDWGTDRKAVDEFINGFREQYPSIKIQTERITTAQYKKQVAGWVNGESVGVDIIYLYAGERLKELARKGLLLSIDDIWKKNNWDNKFPQSAKAAVSSKSLVYAIPMAYYPTGFMYIKSYLLS